MGFSPLYVKDSLFDSSFEYVNMYCEMGINIKSDDGFEEWGVVPGSNTDPNPGPVPEPSSIIALLSGLGSLLAFRRRRA